MVRHQGYIRYAYALLVHPNASHFGTGLRTKKLKTIINRFLNASCPLGVRVPNVLHTKNKNHQKVILIFYGAPSGTRTLDTLIKSQVLYQLS